MLAMLRLWHRRYFSDPQAIILTFLLLLGFAVMLFFGRMLAPLLTAIIIAYLLEGPIAWMEKRGIGRIIGVSLVLLLFCLFVLIGSLAVFPRLWSQVGELVRELPLYLTQGQQALLNLPERYPIITEEQVRELVGALRAQVGNLGQRVLAISLASVTNVITLLVYLVLVPFLVFFLLKDKELILGWISLRLPKERRVASDLWRDLDLQMGNYVRGKFWEILIVGAVAYLCFVLFRVEYALLLATLTGLSVLIPYVGAVVVTLPVALIGYFQWGLGSDLAWLLLAYAVIQGLDGNVLNPLLFARVVNLHPVAIIVAILIFGGLWGFWGIFFAIPLATLVNAVLISWPRTPEEK
ncbi:MAG TPA: AI-2E family transporter [Desulfurivibrio alkaliphilus]|uniref:AI-2E family transporter n=1 Tax=Desulfurivibrio alkaliphilus TaxID=427923 RepID=A0A7C2TKE2_9BACT|nr:AI-2E family transporter [Desulfurivibrio alkaliphilus]